MVFNHGNNSGGGPCLGRTAAGAHHGGGGLNNSSPAPMRRGNGHFGFDSSISSPSDVKRALFNGDEGQGSLPKKSKTSEEDPEDEDYSRMMVVDNVEGVERRPAGSRSQAKIIKVSPAFPVRETLTSASLVCNFEESVFSGRIYPVSQVEGFVAKIGASGSFHPRHLTLPVTVYFYSLCDNLKISSPYMGHIDIGKKGYRVPDKGTIQVTLINPLGTVVKMFVVVYNLSDMPSSSQTFIRQRTLYMPSDLPIDATDSEPQKWLRYVIHLRFASSKSGKIYLHTDIRMIIFNKSDLDTATDFCQDREFELRSYTRTPNNPKFSPRK